MRQGGVGGGETRPDTYDETRHVPPSTLPVPAPGVSVVFSHVAALLHREATPASVHLSTLCVLKERGWQLVGWQWNEVWHWQSVWRW